MVKDHDLKLAVIIGAIVWVLQSLNSDIEVLSTNREREVIDESYLVDSGLDVLVVHLDGGLGWIDPDIAWESHLHVHALRDVILGLNLELHAGLGTKLSVTVNDILDLDVASLAVSDLKTSGVVVVLINCGGPPDRGLDLE